MTQLACDNCGTSFSQSPSRTARGARHYCSRPCRFAHQTGVNNPNWRGGGCEIKCRQCGAMFEKRMFQCDIKRGNRGQFCSLACKYKYQTKWASRREKSRENGRRGECRARAKRKLDGHHTPEEWRALVSKCGNRCQHCKRKTAVERDHIIPLSKGGNDLISNIQPLCQACNRTKWNRIGRCGYLL